MTIKRIGGSKTLIPDPHLSVTNIFGASTSTIDAAGEALHYTGQVFLAAGEGSKTISSAGGKIHYRSSTTTFANAGTTLRVGIQDVSTVDGPPARGDGSYDVYGELVGGTDTITAVTLFPVAMESGSKTLTHGDKISIVFELTARGGSDSVTVQYAGNSENIAQFPVATSYLSAAWARVVGTLICCMEFDDGTFGWIYGTALFSTSPTSQSFNSGTATADEYGVIVRPPMPMLVDGFYAYMQPASASADWEFCLYADPFGTPSLIASVSCDATQVGSSGGNFPFYALLAQAIELKQNTDYAITVRPTTTGNVSVSYWDVTQAGMLDAYQLGQGCYAVRRIDNSGAFSEWNGGTAKTRRMVVGLCAAGFQDAWGDARAQSLIGV